MVSSKTRARLLGSKSAMLVTVSTTVLVIWGIQSVSARAGSAELQSARPASAFASASPAQSPTALSDALLHSLDTLLKGLAAGYGDSSAINFQEVQTNRGSALNLIAKGDSVPKAHELDAVVLLKASGSFGAVGEKLPPGAAPTLGNTLYVVVDAVTSEVLDTAISTTDVDLSALGATSFLQ